MSQLQLIPCPGWPFSSCFEDDDQSLMEKDTNDELKSNYSRVADLMMSVRGEPKTEDRREEEYRDNREKERDRDYNQRERGKIETKNEDDKLERSAVRQRAPEDEETKGTIHRPAHREESPEPAIRYRRTEKEEKMEEDRSSRLRIERDKEREREREKEHKELDERLEVLRAKLRQREKERENSNSRQNGRTGGELATTESTYSPQMSQARRRAREREGEELANKRLEEERRERRADEEDKRRQEEARLRNQREERVKAREREREHPMADQERNSGEVSLSSLAVAFGSRQRDRPPAAGEEERPLTPRQAVRDEERDRELRELDEKIEQLRTKIREREREREREIEDGPRRDNVTREDEGENLSSLDSLTTSSSLHISPSKKDGGVEDANASPDVNERRRQREEERRKQREKWQKEEEERKKRREQIKRQLSERPGRE